MLKVELNQFRETFTSKLEILQEFQPQAFQVVEETERPSKDSMKIQEKREKHR